MRTLPIVSALLAGALAGAPGHLEWTRLAPPAVTKVEQVNLHGQRVQLNTSGGQRPYTAPGQSRVVWVTGPWMDYVRRIEVGDAGITVLATDQHWLLNSNSGEVKLTLIGNSATPGLKTVSLVVECPSFPSDCNNMEIGGTRRIPLVVRVVAVGTLASITPLGNVPVNSRVRFTVTGTRLDVAEVSTSVAGLTNLAVVGTPTAGQFVFEATTPSCGGWNIFFNDRAFGGDDYRYGPGYLQVTSGVTCGLRQSGGIMTGTSGGTSGAPDLVPALVGPLLRHVAAIRKLQDSFCNAMFAQATTAVVRTVTLAPVRWGVTNAGPVAMPSGATVQAMLLRNGVVVATAQVPGLAAGETRYFDWTRPQSATEVGRLALSPDASTRQIYNATGGECVQTVGQAAGNEWQDPQYEVRVAPLAGESNATNNTRTY